MANHDRYAAAYGQAGHAVVAWCLGLCVQEIGILDDENDEAGTIDFACSSHLPLIDRIAVCLAGLEARDLVKLPAYQLAEMSGIPKAIDILSEGLSETQIKSLRDAGHRRARYLLSVHRNKVDRLAAHLIQCGKIDASELMELLNAATR
jgi:ATP-dependent Zn protease